MGCPPPPHYHCTAGGGPAPAALLPPPAAPPPLEHGVDPGAVLVGCVRGVHLSAPPGCVARHPLVLSLVQPGLYQLYVYDVAAVPEGADSGLWAAAGGRPGQAPQPQRVYASVDKLNALCL